MHSSSLLCVNHQGSPLRDQAGSTRAYTPYGCFAGAAHPLTGFTGQPRDPVHGFYHLGNGRRVYQPTLMRFLSADHVSPFGKGGLNAYAYCSGDPVNRTDASGQSWLSLLTNVFFGASGAAGATNMVLARARARIDNFRTPIGFTEPLRPRLHPTVVAIGNTLDTYAYATSVAIRPPAIMGLYDPRVAAASAPAMAIADAGRAVAGFSGYAALPLNVMHEWRRAGARGMHRGHLVRDAAFDAFGISYAWQGVKYVAGAIGNVAGAVGGAVSGVFGRIGARIRGAVRRTEDIEMGVRQQRNV